VTKNGDNVVLDFEDYEKSVSEYYNGFTFFITDFLGDYIDVFHVMNLDEMSDVFVRTMKCVMKLNLEHVFIHGDLKVDNVFYHRGTKDIKLIDFDFSSIRGKHSVNQKCYTNARLIKTMDSETGFMFDFYRMYMSIYIWNRLVPYETVPFISRIVMIVNRMAEMYKFEGIDLFSDSEAKNAVFNDVVYFREWMMYEHTSYPNVVSFLNDYEDLP
jgi:serine/threonine protein kinase